MVGRLWFDDSKLDLGEKVMVAANRLYTIMWPTQNRKGASRLSTRCSIGKRRNGNAAGALCGAG